MPSHVEPETPDAGDRVRRRCPAGSRRWRSRSARVALVAAACGSSPRRRPRSHHDYDASTTTSTAATPAPPRRPRRPRHDGRGGGTPPPRPRPRPSTTACSTTGGALSATCDTQSPSFKLAGAGANSIQPFFTRVFYYYNQANKGVSVNYSPAGSSVGVTDIEQNTVNFGDSEIPIKTPATGTAGNILQVPVDLGGVALSYNLPGVSGGLKLDGPTLAGIYLGKITKWNDPAIAALNPGVNLPGHDHRAGAPGRLVGTGLRPRPVPHRHRADRRGRARRRGRRRRRSGRSPTSVWASSSTPGWRASSSRPPGAIGYVEYAYSLQAGFTNAALKNAAGSFVKPSQSSIAAAGAQAANLSAANFNIVNGPGAGTYPLANFSWTLLYQKQSNTTLGRRARQALRLGDDDRPAAGGRTRVLAAAGQRGRAGAPDAADAAELGRQGAVLLIDLRTRLDHRRAPT